MSNLNISQYTAAVTIDGSNDYLLEYQNSSAAYRKINRNTFLGVSGQPADLSTVQTFTNKTFTSPTITAPVLSGTVTGTYTLGGTPTFPANVVTTTGTQTLTNKTFTSPAINGGTYDNGTITVDSISGHTTSTIVTVGGVQMNNGIVGTAGAVTSTSIAIGAVEPQALVSGSGTGWSWQVWSPSYTNLTIGNGTVEARYTQIGKTVFCRWFFQLGSTSAVGSTPIISPPLTPVASYYTTFGTSPYIGICRLLPPGGAVTGVVVFQTASQVIPLVSNSAGTYLVENSVTSSIPATWTTGNTMFLTFSYETV